LAAGDPVAAADRYAQIGSEPDEAYARLFAAQGLLLAGRRTEAGEQLRLALIFYRSVGASEYVRRGQRLLARLR
jgi:thioredoxin-like negative regulator of GroEL